MQGTLTYRRLRAPRRHGEALVEPPLADAASLVARNVELATRCEYDCQGRSLAQLTADARRGLLEAAIRYTAEYRDVEMDGVSVASLAGSGSGFGVAPACSACSSAAADSLAERPIVLAGHQPELFHPGVWFKNFVLSSLGERLKATPVNLLIDNDAGHAPSIRVPAGSAGHPRLEPVSIDRPAMREAPYEQRGIVDLEHFSSFAGRVQQTIAALIAQPLVAQLWPDAVEAARRTCNLGRSLAEARHRLEGRWGLATLEVPLSQLCEQAPFRWFAAHLLAELPRFHADYNIALAEYRRVAGIRSRTHPVPELAEDGEWLEAPLWLWTTGDSRRRRLFARRRGGEIEISDRAGLCYTLALNESGSAERAVERLGELSTAGLRIRPRALITTMYARLVLGDMFLHGIGGSKYDELTDMIIRRFFRCEPPIYYTLSATLLLPVPRPDVSEDDVRRVEHELRDLEFNPDRHLDNPAPSREFVGRAASVPADVGSVGHVPVNDDRAAALVAQKRRWIETRLLKGERLPRHRGITAANRGLQPYVELQRRRLLAERERLSDELRVARLLGSREFSFCLFPEETLRTLLLELSRGSP